MSHENHAFGIDVSRHQGDIHWDEIAARSPKVVFAGIRATIGVTGRDDRFAYNWAEAKRVGVLRMAYHVVHPELSARLQVNNLIGYLGDDIGELPVVLDCELDCACSPVSIAANILAQAVQIEEVTNRKPIIYSRKTWTDPYMQVNWLKNYDWWLAQYLRNSREEHPGPPDLPKVVKTWLIQQTGDHCYPIGVQSLQMDYDRWNGDEASVRAYAASIPQPAQPEPEQPQGREAMVITDYVFARSKPSTVSTETIVGKLPRKLILRVVKTREIGTDTWACLDIGELLWCAYKVKGTQYLEWC